MLLDGEDAMKGTAPSGRTGELGLPYLALKHQAIQISPFQGGVSDVQRWPNWIGGAIKPSMRKSPG